MEGAEENGLIAGEGPQFIALAIVVLPVHLALGPVPARDAGPLFDIATPLPLEVRRQWDAHFAAVRLGLLSRLEMVADRMAVRRRRSGLWPRECGAIRRRGDMEALGEVLAAFRFTPYFVLGAAVSWVAFRPYAPQDGPLGTWDHATASLGHVIRELYIVELSLLTLY